jgi:hypothetical protein
MPAPDPIWLFISRLETANIDYFVTGSVASIFYGEPRLTHDIDIVVHLKLSDIGPVEKAFSLAEFYCPPADVIIIEMNRRPYGHFNLIHHKTGFKADIYLAGNDSLHDWALANRRKISLSNDQALWLAPPEYVIIRKLEFFREGGSQKHLRDISRMLPQVSDTLNQQFLNTEISNRNLATFWNQALTFMDT